MSGFVLSRDCCTKCLYCKQAMCNYTGCFVSKISGCHRTCSSKRRLRTHWKYGWEYGPGVGSSGRPKHYQERKVRFVLVDFLLSVIQCFHCSSLIRENLFVNVKKKHVASAGYRALLVFNQTTSCIYRHISDLVCSLQVFSTSQPSSIFANIIHRYSLLNLSNFLLFLKHWSTK